MRPISLASRFLATLLSTCVLPLVVFGWFTLIGVRGLIDSQVVSTFVPRLARDQAQKIDGRLDQIVQTCAMVREIARRPLASVGPQRPRELRAFGEQILLVPDLFDNNLDLLLLTDDTGEVVFWQDGFYLDPGTRDQRALRIPTNVADRDWFVRAQRESQAIFLPWGRSPLLQAVGDVISRDPAAHHLGLAIDVPIPGRSPGVLFALIRWQEVQQVLDAARDALVAAGYPSSQAFLVDAEGTLHAHTDRSRYGERLQPDALRERLAGATDGNARFVDVDGRSSVCGFHRFGHGPHRTWTLGLAVAEDELFAATDAFTRVLVVATVVTLLVLVVWSLLASRAIARPIHELVAATGRVARGDLEVRVPQGGGRELGELAASFNTMASELAAGRARLLVAEREKAWAEMARQVAHEIKNPLTPMRMAAELLQRARREGDARADAIADRLARTVHEQTEALDRIAGAFRWFAGSPKRELRVVEVDSFLGAVADAAAALFEGAPVTVRLDLAAPGACVEIDRGEMQRVFVNLLQNASQARPDGVTVTIESSCAGPRVEVRVVDDGPGIPASARARLFEPYFTTKTSGTGLGLAICRRIVEAHGGSIRLDDKVATGTAMVLELPLVAGAPGVHDGGAGSPREPRP